MSAIEADRPARFHYGWVIVASSYFVGLLTSGLLSYTRGIFLVPMTEGLGVSRLDLSLGFTISGIVAAVTAPTAGWLLDRYSVTRLMAVMAVWTALGYFAIAAIDGRLGLFIVMGLFFGAATMHLGGPAPAKLVIGWFERQRGFALSLISMGASTAGVVTPPIATALIEALGWRWTYASYGVMTLVVVVPLILLTLRAPPEPPPPATPGTGRLPGTDPIDRIWHRSEYLANSTFWGIVVIFGVMGCVFAGVSLHLFAHMTDLGIDPIRAAFVLSLMAGLALASKPAFGALVDRLDARVSVMVSLVAQAIGMGLLLVAESYQGLLVAATAFGFGYGGMVPLRNALTAIAFGTRSFGEVSGAMRTAMAPLSMGGMPLAGWIFDLYGSYAAAFTAFLALYVLAIASVWLLRFRQSSIDE
jgi:MFS family permease